MIESILHAAGMRTGLYTSPHLERINERIRIDGKEISDADFAVMFTRLRAVIEELLASGRLSAHPTFFECVTAVAFDYFASAGVQFAVCEVGMGGRLDCPPRTFCCRKSPQSRRLISITKIIWDIRLRKSPCEKGGDHQARRASRQRVSGAFDRSRRGIRQRVAQQGAFLVEIENAFRIEDVTSRNGCFFLHGDFHRYWRTRPP